MVGTPLNTQFPLSNITHAKFCMKTGPPSAAGHMIRHPGWLGKENRSSSHQPVIDWAIKQNGCKSYGIGGAWEQEVKANALCQFVLFINSFYVCKNYRTYVQERVKGEILWNCETTAELGCLYDWTNFLSGCHMSLTTPRLCNSVNLLEFTGRRGLCSFPTPLSFK